MNGKKAKALRRLAQSHISVAPEYDPITTHTKFFEKLVADEHGNQIVKKVPYQVVNPITWAAGSFKHVYKILKRVHKGVAHA